MSTGGLASPAVGALAGATSLQTALAPLVVMPALTCLTFWTLRDPGDPILPTPEDAKPPEPVESTSPSRVATTTK